MLSRRNKTLENIINTLKEYRDNVADGENTEDSDASTRKAILVGLLGFLESCI
jgi:beta-catenin-like protein 1